MSTAQTLPHLLVIDGNYLVRTIFEAQGDVRLDQRVKDTLRSAASSLHRALSHHRPTHAMAVFDYGGPTWRHDLYPGYKSARTPIPHELAEGIKRFMALLPERMGVKTISLPIVEADDVIGTLVTKWQNRGLGPSTVLTRDKDMLQLLTTGARIYEHFRGEVRDASYVGQKFGVLPEQIGDLLALMGDASDSIPGVPGIGAKTGASLLREHQTLEGILAAAAGGAIPGAVGAKLNENAAIARLSRRLVHLECDLSLGITWSELRLSREASTEHVPTPAASSPAQGELLGP